MSITWTIQKSLAILNNTSIEMWREVQDFPSYQVSDLGRVRSIDREETIYNRHDKPFTRIRKGKIKKLQKNSMGYPCVNLCKDGKYKNCLVHRLVLIAFTGLSGDEVNHKDGNKENNYLHNLEWSDRRLNSLHSTRILGKNRGEDSGTSILTEGEVLEIADRIRSGEYIGEIALDYPVTAHAIYKIAKGNNWSWLTGLGKEDSYATVRSN